MNVGEMLKRVRAMLLESALDCFYSPETLVGFLNEACRKHRADVVEADHDGEWLGEETTANYTASARWVALTTWSALGTPLKIHSVIRPGASTDLDAVVPYASPRGENLRAARFNDEFFYVLLGSKIGLRPLPTMATSLRILYTPPILPMVHTGNIGTPPVLWDVYEPPWLPDHYELLCAYAAVQAAISEDKPIGDLARRHSQLEEKLYNFVGAARQGTAPAHVKVTSRSRYLYG